jgi:hypothetical protein
MLRDLQFELWIGDAAEIRTKRVRNQKTDRLDRGQLRLCQLGNGISFLADFPEPWLVQSHATAIIPLYKCVVFVRLLDRTEFSSRLSEISQTLDAITGIQFRVGSRGLHERWSLGSV